MYKPLSSFDVVAILVFSKKS